MHCRYLLFSLVAAFFLLAGFAMAHAVNGSIVAGRVAHVRRRTATRSLSCLAIGFLIKAGAIGVHVWLPGAYAEADDDVSAMLSAVVSKVRDLRPAGRHLCRDTLRGDARISPMSWAGSACSPRWQAR